VASGPPLFVHGEALFLHQKKTPQAFVAQGTSYYTPADQASLSSRLCWHLSPRVLSITARGSTAQLLFPCLQHCLIFFHVHPINHKLWLWVLVHASTSSSASIPSPQALALGIHSRKCLFLPHPSHQAQGVFIHASASSIPLPLPFPQPFLTARELSTLSHRRPDTHGNNPGFPTFHSPSPV
jgi:hypothetical protein